MQAAWSYFLIVLELLWFCCSNIFCSLYGAGWQSFLCTTLSVSRSHKLYAAQNSLLLKNQYVWCDSSHALLQVLFCFLRLFLAGLAKVGLELVRTLNIQLGHGQPLYMILFVSALAFLPFSQRWCLISDCSKSKEVWDFIPSIRLASRRQHIVRYYLLTLVGACYLSAVALLPEFLIIGWHVPFYFF